MTAQFKPGDIVQLKSGGPKMTVEYMAGNAESRSAYCAWFNDGKLEQKYISEHLLVNLAAPPPPSPRHPKVEVRPGYVRVNGVDYRTLNDYCSCRNCFCPEFEAYRGSPHNFRGW